MPGLRKRRITSALNRVQFQDGTASIGVASGFKPQLMRGGQFTASSEDGAFAHLCISCPVLDPNGSLYRTQMQVMRNSGGSPSQIPGQVVLAYDSDPLKAWKKYMIEFAHQPNAPPNPEPQFLHTAVVEKTLPGWNGRLLSGTMTWRGEPFVLRRPC